MVNTTLQKYILDLAVQITMEEDEDPKTTRRSCASVVLTRANLKVTIYDDFHERMSCSSSRKRFAAVAHRTGPREHPLTVVGEWDRGEVFSTPPPRTFFEDTITRIVTQGRGRLIDPNLQPATP